MITISKIAIYLKRKGDNDRYAKSDLSELEWALIRSLLQDIWLVNNGRADESYAFQVNKALERNCDSPATITALKMAAENGPV